MIFELPGRPIPLQRARMSRGYLYDPLSIVKRDLRFYIKYRLKSEIKPIFTPFELKITFYMPMPKSWKIAKREAKLGTPHDSRPDTTNLTKMIEDTFNGMLWSDDSLIWHTDAKKIWAEEGKTIFETIS